ncbi:proline dehydrogenase [Photorhabdus luminescens subsp. luminescens]|uniref:Hydroxymethyl cephem carbamoyltransferase n=1 Tax=Photorhabdus luminescens TaxID=29488 RepID=A0A1G5QZ84_PHOLU|nr:carbamoyltransferase C-terminal domain-containing protein [Photorhabdus luminescens]KMW72761.1 proline dehydrogenase [Photorhabdus luminescens subsp. luminescens]SCZ66908.1 hydroxymethyl cephem carbamoyltransferase [Photorhabdus luminescens]
MKIISFKPGHDGHISYLKDSTLAFSYEAEKDSGLRYSPVTAELFIETLSCINEKPDVIALSGWSVGVDPRGRNIGAGYLGLEYPKPNIISFLGTDLYYFTSSHERSHLLGAYGMSPFQQGQPCYALLWEGHIGSFYYIDKDIIITKLANVLLDPGIRYAFAYGLADPKFNFAKGKIRLGDAGKMMALAAYSDRNIKSIEDEILIDELLKPESAIDSLYKDNFKNSPYYNVGVESVAFKQFAGHFSDKIFEFFYNSIKPFVREHIPLLISGGCGLNCDWNSKWLNCGIFSDVFVPPCTNDVGSAIGTAIDAQYHFTKIAKIHWDVYSGQEFIDDLDGVDGFIIRKLNFNEVACRLFEGKIIAWAKGKAEIGPRALGNRSILAAPFLKETLKRLNLIKKRESFRPIAPICLEEDFKLYFNLNKPSPYMLFFSMVLDGRLQAITHVDGSSRPQTVNKLQNKDIHELLSSFKEVSGYGVLCNTSLNFNGTGFINRTSDVYKYAKENDLDGFVVNDRFYMKK